MDFSFIKLLVATVKKAFVDQIELFGSGVFWFARTCMHIE